MKGLRKNQDKNGYCFNEEMDIKKRGTEYCTELYNHEQNGNQTAWNFLVGTEYNDSPILWLGEEIVIDLDFLI